MKKNQENGQASDNALIETLKQMTIAQIRQVADTASEEELHFLMDGVEMNERLAAYSEDKKVGVGIADTLRSEKGSEVLKNDLLTRIMLKVSSAAESRLDGCPLPTMSSSGAGTKGLVVILPVSEAADALGVSMEKKGACACNCSPGEPLYQCLYRKAVTDVLLCHGIINGCIRRNCLPAGRQ